MHNKYMNEPQTFVFVKLVDQVVCNIWGTEAISLRCAKCYKCLEPKCGGITPDREVEATLVLVIFRLTLSVFNKQHYFLKTERM